jgi:hypothetical protein
MLRQVKVVNPRKAPKTAFENWRLIKWAIAIIVILLFI